MAAFIVSQFCYLKSLKRLKCSYIHLIQAQCSTLGEPAIPTYNINYNEPTEMKRSRLVYQSRKRGMLENGLLLSTFAGKYLMSFSTEELEIYDKLINIPSNDWDLYYWVTGVRETPKEFESNVLDLLKKHCQNESKESRFHQPDLH